MWKLFLKKNQYAVWTDFFNLRSPKIIWYNLKPLKFLPYVLKYDINVEAVFIHPEYHQQNNEVAKNDMYWDISLTVSFSFAEI